MPVYNSEKNLPDLISRLQTVLTATNEPFEVILVNDASRDGSWDVIAEIANKYSFVSGVDLMRNFGQHSALLCGIRRASYAVVVTMDDDLQHPPEEIPKMLAALTERVDVVYGVPVEEQHGLLRDAASRVSKLALQSAMGAEIARNASAFRMFRTQVRDAFAEYQSQYVSIDVLLTWGTTRFAAVRVRHDPRRQGVSNYTVRKLIVHTLNMTTGFSVVPLQIASLLGFACTALGILLLCYVLGRYVLQGTTVPGFPFLASVVAIFSGAQLFALGMIGEYLARIHFRVMFKPPYAVRTIVAAAAETDSHGHSA